MLGVTRASVILPIIVPSLYVCPVCTDMCVYAKPGSQYALTMRVPVCTDLCAYQYALTMRVPVCTDLCVYRYALTYAHSRRDRQHAR